MWDTLADLALEGTDQVRRTMIANWCTNISCFKMKEKEEHR